MVSNTGTYLDTPFHRFPDGHDLAGLDPARVADVPGVLVDATGGGRRWAPTLLAGLDLAGRAVLVRTGWDRHWGSDAYGDPERHPYLGVDAAEALVAAGAAVVGIDSVNIDGTRTGERPDPHHAAGGGHPDRRAPAGPRPVGDRPFRFYAVPPAVRGMGTFPVRALAIVDM